MIQIGDKITIAGGVNATDIPIGATVSYASGVCRSNTTTEVRMRDGKKVLAILGIPFGRKGYPDLFSHGQGGLDGRGGWGGTMTILTMPD